MSRWMLTGQMVEDFGDRDNPGREWDSFSLQPVRIARSIIVFLMVKDDLAYFGGKPERENHARAYFGMVFVSFFFLCRNG